MLRLSALIASIVCLLPGCRATGESERLVVASDLANKPFAWVDEDGLERGRDVAMMQALAALLDRDLEWRRMEFGELLEAAETGAVDIVCATLGVTADRAKRVRFSRPYFHTELSVVVLAMDGGPELLADLSDARVGAAAGTTSELAVNSALPSCVASFGHKGDAARLEALRAGTLDAVVMDGPAAARVVAESGGVLRLLKEPLAREDYALALPRNTEWADALDAGIGHLFATGAMELLDREYGLSPAGK